MNAEHGHGGYEKLLRIVSGSVFFIVFVIVTIFCVISMAVSIAKYYFFSEYIELMREYAWIVLFALAVSFGQFALCYGFTKYSTACSVAIQTVYVCVCGICIAYSYTHKLMCGEFLIAAGVMVITLTITIATLSSICGLITYLMSLRLNEEE